MRGYLSVVQSVLLVSLYDKLCRYNIIYITFSIVRGESQHDSALVLTAATQLMLAFSVTVHYTINVSTDRCYLY